MSRFFLCVLLCLLILAVVGPLVTPHTYNEVYLARQNFPPSVSHWFGTDELGRDLFARCCQGLRLSLFIALSAGWIDLVIGVSIGLLSTQLEGYGEEILNRIVDVIGAIPYLLLALLLTVMMGPGMQTLILAIALTGWINMARVVRGKAKQLTKSDFFLASISLGTTRLWRLRYHILPALSSTVLVTLVMTISAALYTETFLSFLGLGVQSPEASLGSLISDGLTALRFYPWRVFFPGGLLAATLFSCHAIFFGGGHAFTTFNR